LTIPLGGSARRLLRLDRPEDEPEDHRDRPSHGRGASDAAESPGLIALILGAIRAASPPAPADRRTGFRHPAADREAWVGWWSDDDFIAVPARVRDISRGGARAVLLRRPPHGESVWFYKEVEDTLAFVRGEVAGVTPSPGGSYAVRFRFAVPCPTLLLQAVVCERRGERSRTRPGSLPSEDGR
jgi:hypothetical protein